MKNSQPTTNLDMSLNNMKKMKLLNVFAIRNGALASCLILFLISGPLFAINHNPPLQDQHSSWNLTVESVEATSGNGATASVASGSNNTISIEWTLTKTGTDGSAGTGLTQAYPIEVIFTTEAENPPSYTYTSDGAVPTGPQTEDISVEDFGCSIEVELKTFDQSAKVTVNLDTSSGNSDESINIKLNLGVLDNGRSGGVLQLYSQHATSELLDPAALRYSIGSSGEAIMDPNAPGVIRQLVTDTVLTDITSNMDGSYQIAQYHASAKGPAGTGGVYTINSGATAIKQLQVNASSSLDILNTNDDTLFHSARHGDCYYRKKVRPGQYSIDLYFAELYQDEAGKALMEVYLEDEQVIEDLDVFQEAGGKNTAYIATVSELVDDGYLDLDIDTTVFSAQIAAVKIESDRDADIASTSDDTLYQSERYGDFSYDIALPNAEYEVTLYFSEAAFSTVGSRLMDVSAEGAIILDDYDIYAAVGAINTALTETFTVSVADAELNLDFTGVSDEAKVQAIKIADAANATVVAAINCGGDAHTSSDLTAFSADQNFTGGDSDYHGKLIAAVNMAGRAFEDESEVNFVSDLGPDTFNVDEGIWGGEKLNLAIDELAIIEVISGAPDETTVFELKGEPRTGQFDKVDLKHPSNKKIERRNRIWSGDRTTYDEIYEVEDSVGNTARKEVQSFTHSNGYSRLTRKTTFLNDGSELNTNFEYYKPSERSGTRVKKMTLPGGKVRTFDYDQFGRPNETVTVSDSYGTDDNGDPLKRTESISYVPGYSGDSYAKQTVVTMQGMQGGALVENEISRRWKVKIDDPDDDYIIRKSIIATEPGVAIDAASNLVTETCYYKPSHSVAVEAGQIKWQKSPDGTLTTYEYEKSGSDLIETITAGADDSGVVTDGIQTIRTINYAGQVVSEVRTDLQLPGSPLWSWEATNKTPGGPDIDLFGRVKVKTYGDGSKEFIEYVGADAGCGSCSGSGEWLISQTTDRNGVIEMYTYDELGRLEETYWPLTRVTEKYYYDASGRRIRTEKIDPDDTMNIITLNASEYDPSGQLISSTNGPVQGVDYTYTYTENGKMVQVDYPDGGQRLELYYSDGSLKRIEGNAVAPMKYEYGTWSGGTWKKETKISEWGVDSEWATTYFDLAGRTVRIEQPDLDGQPVETRLGYYTGSSLLSFRRDPDGNYTRYEYDGRARTLRQGIDMELGASPDTETLNLNAKDRITEFSYDVVTEGTRTLNRTVSMVYTNLTSDDTLVVSESKQDSYGNYSEQIDIHGRVTSREIDRDSTPSGDWTVTLVQADNTTVVEQYVAGRLDSRAQYERDSDPGDDSVTGVSRTYDAFGRVLTENDARTGITSYTYTPGGLVETMTTNNGADTTTYGYDEMGRQTSVDAPDTTIGSVTNANITYTSYYPNGQVKARWGDQTYSVSYDYDDQGRMKEMHTWRNNAPSDEPPVSGGDVTKWFYDYAHGWLERKEYADGKGTDYTYSPAGRLKTRTWDRGIVTTYGYNAAGDLTTTDYSDATPDITITYTRWGAQDDVTDALGTRSFAYNADLTLNTETINGLLGTSATITRKYEDGSGSTVDGRPSGFTLDTSLVTGDDYDVTYTYDATGRLSTVNDTHDTFTYGYKTDSNLIESVTVASLSNFDRKTGYELHRDVITQIQNYAVSTTLPVSQYDYTVNSIGQRTSRDQSGSAMSADSADSFSYNANGELTGSDNDINNSLDRTYTYDGIGNRTASTEDTASFSYTSNLVNQYTAVTGLSTPTYDDDGNMLTNGAGWTFAYNGENRLISATDGTDTITFTYDYMGRRVKKDDGTNIQAFIYDGWNLIAQYEAPTSTSTWNLNSTYTWGTDLSGTMQGAGGVGGLLSTYDVTNSENYVYTYDATVTSVNCWMIPVRWPPTTSMTPSARSLLQQVPTKTRTHSDSARNTSTQKLNSITTASAITQLPSAGGLTGIRLENKEGLIFSHSSITMEPVKLII
jgi:YD repeat-containing protein